MSDKSPKQAEEHHGWWPGWIWSLPIAALVLVLWLGVRSWTQSGPQVQVVFPEIADLKAGDTKVKFEGMEVGQVEESKLEPDLRHLRVTLRLRPDMSGHLGKGTQFWIIGKNPGLAHLSDLKTIITGVSIGISPRPGPKQDKYQGLANAPVLGFGASGTKFQLHAARLGSVQKGTPLYYLGEQVGQVESYSMTGGRGFEIAVYVDTPFDRLVHDGSRFWRAGPLHLSTGGNGPTVQFQSVPALFTGAIAFETPLENTPAAAAGHDFTLYGSEGEAKNAPDSRSLAYRMVFHNVTGVPDKGATVKLIGKSIGSVTATALQYDPKDGRLVVLATVMLDPRGIALPDGASWTNPREQMNDMLRHLIDNGMRAELSASPPVIGAQQVVLTMTGGQKASLGDGDVPEIPTMPGGGGVSGIMASVSDVATKLNQLPLTQIADNLRDVSGKLAQLANSPEAASTLRQVDRSTANLQRISAEMRKQLPATLTELRRTVTEARQSLASARNLISAQGTTAPGTAGLPETLYEIDRTARSLRGLADMLVQHPSALVTGR